MTRDWATTTLSPGLHNLDAIYSGDATHAGSTSNVVVHSVLPAATVTTLSSTPNPSFHGQSVTLTAVVTEGSGTITFRDGGAVLAIVPLAGGTATFSTTTLGLGLHNLDAIYSGDATHAGSTSNVVVHSVLVASAVPTLSTLRQCGSSRRRISPSLARPVATVHSSACVNFWQSGQSTALRSS